MWDRLAVEPVDLTVLRSTPVRLAQALERMEAAAEILVDADDQPHLVAVR
jgi:hypothetical protein